MEVQRYSNLLPSGVPHFCTKDVTLNGLTIPANTIIHGLYTEVMKVGLPDEGSSYVYTQGPYWEDGLVFQPLRFLSASGELRPDVRLVPHGLGKRGCPGQTLARTQLYLFFCGLLQQFSLLPEVCTSALPG